MDLICEIVSLLWVPIVSFAPFSAAFRGGDLVEGGVVVVAVEVGREVYVS